MARRLGATAKRARTFPRDAAFALAVGFCSVPVVALGVFNKSIRDSARPYVERFTEVLDNISNTSYAASHRLLSPDHSLPPPTAPAVIQQRVLSIRKSSSSTQPISIEGCTESIVVPQSPLFPKPHDEGTEVVVAAKDAEGDSPTRSRLRLRGAINLGDLEAASRAIHQPDK